LHVEGLDQRPREVDGVPVEGTWRAHQVPLAETRENPEHRAQLEAWTRLYWPGELLDEQGAPFPELITCAPDGDTR
jgi:xylulose-5-phosphate/fructose-6-phosphate phosphoketolase